MFCSNCGSELLENVKFCAKCGTPVPEISRIQSSSESDGETASGGEAKEVSRQKKKIGDGAIDFASSKLAGKKMETIRISMEDMISLLKAHYVDPATTEDELKKIQKAVNGGLISVTHLQSKDGRYNLSVKVAMQLGGRLDLLHPGDSNWIRVVEEDTGKVYQYSAMTWGKFKKAVKTMIEEAK